MCLEYIAPDIAAAINALGSVYSGLDWIVYQALTNLFEDEFCDMCSGIEEINTESCDDSSRRLSANLWTALEKHGPDYLRAGHHQRNFTTPEMMKKTERQPRRRQMVENDQEVCPNAPEASFDPAYSTTEDVQYDFILSLHQLKIYPNLKKTLSDSSFVKLLEADDDDKFSSRTNQVSSNERGIPCNISKHQCASTYFSPLSLNPTQQNAVAAVFVVELAVDTALKAFEQVCEAIPENFCVGVCGWLPLKAFCFGISAIGQIVMQVFDGVRMGIDLHDGVVDGAEIQATLANTESIIEWTCNLEQYAQGEFLNMNTLVSNEASTSRTLMTTEHATTRDRISDEATTSRATVSSEHAATRDLISSESVAIQSAVSSASTDTQALILEELGELKTYIDNRLDTIDDTLRIVRRLLISPEGQRPGYNDKGVACDKDGSNCPLPDAYPY